MILVSQHPHDSFWSIVPNFIIIKSFNEAWPSGIKFNLFNEFTLPLKVQHANFEQCVGIWILYIYYHFLLFMHPLHFHVLSQKYYQPSCEGSSCFHFNKCLRLHIQTLIFHIAFSMYLTRSITMYNCTILLLKMKALVVFICHIIFHLRSNTSN